MIPDLSSFLSPCKSPHASGADLRYSPLYDALKEARREDDPRLTQGVWEQDVKQADWKQVEDLATQALLTQTKDLNLVGWLGEAWITLYGLEGLQTSLGLVETLCRPFWETLYPYDPDDPETRLRCLEWMDTQWVERLQQLPISQTSMMHDHLYRLVDWIDGHYYAKLAKQNPESSTKPALANHASLLSKLRDAMSHTDLGYYERMIGVCTSLQSDLQRVEQALQPLLAPQTHTWNKLKAGIEIVLQLARSDPRFQKAPEPLAPEVASGVNQEPSKPCDPSRDPEPCIPLSTPASPVSDRQALYRTIESSLAALKTCDPHGPAVPVLEAALRWKDLSFLDLLKVFEDVGLNPQQVLKLFKV